jgi:hypothetical protein
MSSTLKAEESLSRFQMVFLDSSRHVKSLMISPVTLSRISPIEAFLPPE